jgi:hypothetical protein
LDTVSKACLLTHLNLHSENEASLAFAGFKAFNTDFRKEFRTLEIKDSKAVTFKADSEGLGRIVGFASTFLFEQKINGQMSAGDTVWASP